MQKIPKFILISLFLATQGCNSGSRAPTAQDVICSEKISHFFSVKGISTRVLVSRHSTQHINASYNDTSFTISELYDFIGKDGIDDAVYFECDFEGMILKDFIVKF